MSTATKLAYPLPTTGACIALVAKLFGVTTEGALGCSRKQFERLAKGQLSSAGRKGYQPLVEEVSRRVIDEIVRTFTGEVPPVPITDRVLVEKDSLPLKYALWKQGPDGELLNLRDHLVRDFIEFIHRHEMLVHRFGSGESEPAIIYQWLGMFAVPFLVMNLIEYQRNGADIERGMQRGRFWYLPEPILPGPGEKFRIKWPTNSALEWWQDLLGSGLESFARELCAQGKTERDYDEENAKREVREWLKGDRPPAVATIERWCRQKWDYRGAFRHEVSLPLSEQWLRCKQYLVGKGLHEPGRNWLAGFPAEARAGFGPRYRGHQLELEILPFEEASFEDFFKAEDAIRAGLPVEAFIERVAERFRAPTNTQLRARLLIGAAFHRAFSKAFETLGPEAAVRLLGWFKDLHLVLMRLHNRANKEAEGERAILRLLREDFSWGDDRRDAVEWLFDEASWQRLPAELAARFLEAKVRQGRPS